MSRTIVSMLHNHSSASDGDLSTTELFQWVQQAKLQAFALRDHDSIGDLTGSKDSMKQILIFSSRG